jgi:hypothetical protein
MKSNKPSFTLEDVIEHLKYMNNKQLNDCGNAIAMKEMAPNEANRRILMIREVQYILCLALRKGMSFEDFRQVMESQPDRKVAEQKRLF